MYRFLLTPRWLLAHVVLVGVLAVCLTAGLWQLRRLDERRDRNALIEARAQEPPLGAAALFGRDPEDLPFRVARLTGSYDTDRTMLLRNRPGSQAVAGNHVLTPLVTDAGVVLVDRGWVPLDQPLAAVPDPPSGRVTVTGLVRETEDRGPPVLVDDDGGVTTVGRVDTGEIGEALPYRLAPVWVLLQDQMPAPADLPLLVDPPDLDDGPHLSYALQWFIFAAIAPIVYGALIRRELKGYRKRRLSSAA